MHVFARVLSSFALVLVLAACEGHPQKDGTYVFTPQEVYRDDCGLLAPPAKLWGGEVLVSGLVVRMNYDLLDTQLVGSFLPQTERFVIDGSVANATATANGQECLLDLVQIHLDAVTQCPSAFEGTMRVSYQARRPDRCVCELGVRFRAVHESSPDCDDGA